MLARDIRVEELINTDPKKGFPLFGSNRIMVTGISSLKRFGDDLTQTLGMEKLGIVLSRLGYEAGMTAAMTIANEYDFDTPLEWFKARTVIFAKSGIVDEEITELNFEPKGKTLYFKGVWHDSFETMNYIAQVGRNSNIPVCNYLRGFASGYSSAVLGGEVLIHELTCTGQGHKQCTFEGRSLNKNEPKTKTFRDYFTFNSFETEIERLKNELIQTQKNLAVQNVELQKLKKNNDKPGSDSGIIFGSKIMANMLYLAERVASAGVNVLIQGESGTGKELVARYIHEKSNRKNDPFIAINCAAIPSKLLEAELFGYKKGAFTGAESNKKGLLLEAGKGTFFLDEIGEMPIDLQAKLLRTIQEKEIRPLGSVKNVPFKARIIAATNQNLHERVNENKFRNDLFYRLSVFPLVIQPLRNRKEDIILLARFFLKTICPEHLGFTSETVRLLESYHWPGNVRELENCIEYSYVMALKDRIEPVHLPPAVTENNDSGMKQLFSAMPSMKELEMKYIRLVLENTNGNKTEACRILGISQSTLWRYLKK